MNVPRYVLLRRLLLAVLLVASASASQTSVDASPLTLLRNAPLSLPRLTANPAKFGKKPVPAGAFEVLDLTPGENAVRKSRGEAAYLEIEPGAEWQRKLRTPRRAVSYVSFTLNASVGSLVDVGGARFAIAISDRDPTYAALRPLGAGIPISHEMPFLLFGGARMAPLNIVTVQLDRKAGTWAMWFRDNLIASGLPLDSERKDRDAVFSIAAGKAGAWLCGVVYSDENPLFDDVNHNLVPDLFERESAGTLLPANAPDGSRELLTKSWETKRRSSPPTEFVLNTPLPDSFPEDCTPAGEVVHGMPGGKKIRVAESN